jgi:long-chain fatty acid transport protein
MTANLKPTFAAASVCVVLAAWAGMADAAGFALIEQSPSQVGNAFAGGAASAEDASTIYFNPAGMTQLSGRQIVVGVHGVKPSAEFNNNGSHMNAPLTALPLSGGNGGDAGGWGAVPNLYVSWQLSDQWFIGLGVNSPFGLTTDYDSNWIGRYQGIKSDLMTVNINPSIAYKVNDKISLGAGLSAQYIDADLTKAIDFGTICNGGAPIPAGCGVGLTPQGGDGGQELKANGWGYGFNLGALFQVSPDMRIGVAYRSQIKHELDGDSTLTGVPVALRTSRTFQNTSASADLTLPDSASVSVYQQFGEKWAMMGDITWTHWSTFDELRVKFSNGAADNVTPENWSNTWRVSLGLTYQVNEAWKLRGGVAYDQTPVSDTYRTVRIPDNDRTWLAVGASWRFTPAASLDFGYAHLFVKDASINKSEPVSGTVIGTYDNSVDIVSLGLSYRF